MVARTVAASAFLLILIADLNFAQTDPTETDLTESVRVHLIQAEVTVWPKSGPADSCRGFTAEDFALTVNGRSREIEAVDWIGSVTATTMIDDEPATEPGPPPLSLVLYFDLWHLDTFVRDFTCPFTKPLAFEQARRMVREEFRPGDRLLLVTFAGWPRVHGGWIRDPDKALRALDRLEVSPFVVSAQRRHSHEHPWVDGLKSLMLALGRYPGRKEVIYLGDDFRFGEIDLRGSEIAARAQANQVTIHSVDLLWSCRLDRGPTCDPPVDPGGLYCTPFRHPLALGPIASNTGGRMFSNTNDGIATAVRRVREVFGCRYRVSFLSYPRESRKATPRFRVLLERKGFELRAPIAFQNPDRPPKEREELDALFLLPQFGRGLAADVGLWPLKPSGKRNRWKALLLARIRRAPEGDWPEDLDEVVVDAVAHRADRIYGEFRKVLAGEELARLRDGGGSRLFVFPLENVRPGDTTVVVRAHGADGDLAVNTRGWYTVPEPPAPGEAGPWFLIDSLARFGTEVTLLPSMDGIVTAEEQATILGYGCRGDELDLSAGSLINFAGTSMNVPIRWLNGTPPPPGREACGWLVGRVAHLEPGLWRFEPPESLTPAGRFAPIDFRVAGAAEKPSSSEIDSPAKPN